MITVISVGVTVMTSVEETFGSFSSLRNKIFKSEQKRKSSSVFSNLKIEIHFLFLNERKF